MHLYSAQIAWVTTHYVAPDRQTAIEIATELGFAKNGAGVWWHPNGHVVDVIGQMWGPPTLGPGGEVLAPGEPLPGFAINIAWCDAPDPRAEPYRVFPTTPHRVWA